MRKDYFQWKNLWFKNDTTMEVANIVDFMYQTGKRYKIYSGCTETGRVFAEEYDTVGTVSKTTGELKIPILITRKGNHGGAAISTGSILAVKEVGSKHFMFKNKLFIQPTVEIKETKSVLSEYKYETIFNGDLYSRHRTLRSAQICKNKLG